MLLSAAAQYFSIVDETQTYDENSHLLAGYLYWRTGDMRWNAEHPPLAKLLSAIPLLWLNPDLPKDHPSWKSRDLFRLSYDFLYSNRVAADRMLLAARSVTMAQFLFLITAVFVWTRRQFGDGPGLAAAAILAFDPNLIAHGRYVTSDLPVTLYSFLAFAGWYEFLKGGRWWWCVLGGLGLGAALATKFSALALLVVFPLVGLAGALLWKRGWARAAVGLAIAFLLAYAVLIVSYLPEGPRLLPGIRLLDKTLPSVRSELPPVTELDRAMIWASTRLGLAANSWFYGLHILAEHDKEGHEGYLLGEISKSGWWYYFPVVFLVKTPAGLLIALSVAIAAVRQRWRESMILIIPPVVLFAFATQSRINIGMRHILPVYPFLAIAVSLLLWRGRWRYVLVGCCAFVALECALIHPYYLSFFNIFAGGPSHGDSYLLDSNIDWGQDVKRLKRYMDAAGADHVCIAYFGSANLRYYGVPDWTLPRTWETEEQAKLDCLCVASVTVLHDLYIPRGSFSWLRERQPDARIGYSMKVWDLRKRTGYLKEK